MVYVKLHPYSVTLKLCSSHHVQLYKEPDNMTLCRNMKKSEVVTALARFHNYPVLRSPEHQHLWSSMFEHSRSQKFPTTRHIDFSRAFRKSSSNMGFMPCIIAYWLHFPQEQALERGWHWKKWAWEGVRRRPSETSRSTTAIIVIRKNWIQPEYPPGEESINEFWHLSAIQKKGGNLYTSRGRDVKWKKQVAE